MTYHFLLFPIQGYVKQQNHSTQLMIFREHLRKALDTITDMNTNGEIYLWNNSDDAYISGN